MSGNAAKAEQRSLTDVRLEQQIWEIWGYCRLNKDSLDSGRHCKIIREVVVTAVADVQKRCELLAVELANEKESSSALKQEIRRLKKESLQQIAVVAD